jgi:alcohol dehydrogenase
MHVATTASEAKSQLVKDLGAETIVHYKSEAFEDILHDYDVVFDTMSFTYESRTLGGGSRVLKQGSGGHYLNILSSDWSLSDSGAEVANGFTSWFNVVWYKIAHALGQGPAYNLIAVVPNGAQLSRVLQLVADGSIRPIIDSKYHLKSAAEAHAHLEQGHVAGKVVLLIP